MILIGVVEDNGHIVQVLGCKVASLPVSYLGLPLVLLVKQRQYGIQLKKILEEVGELEAAIHFKRW